MEKYKLSELIVIKNGRDHKDLPNGDYPVFGSGGIMRYVNSYLYDKPSVLLPRKGSLSNIQYSDTPFWTVDTLYYTEINEELVSPYYLYRYLRLLDMSRLDSGTGVPSMTFDSYYNINVFLPNIEEQRRVASILQKIDAKIALNHQINDNLEAMAKQLYDYWFVQFDFPNEEGKPYKSSGGAMVWNEKLKREIPTSFDVKSLSEIIEVKDGTHDSPKPQDNGYFLLTSKHLTERGLDYASAYKISKEDYESINKRSKVDTNDILFSMIGTIGNSYFVEETKINFAIKNMALFKTSAKRWFSEYMYLYLSSCDYKHYEGNSLSGSIQKFVPLRTLRDMPILYHEDIIKVFAKEVRNIITMMVNLRKENIELTKQRDELLPLLMNGQASVNSD